MTVWRVPRRSRIGGWFEKVHSNGWSVTTPETSERALVDLEVLNRRNYAAVADEELRNWSLDYLNELQIEMGRQCNVRCHMCCQTDFDPGSKQAEVVWKEKLRPGYEKAKILTISGGEPTILPGARQLLTMLMGEYPHLMLNCITNGVLFRGLWIDAFVKQGALVNVSLNAIAPELYSKIVQFGRQKDVVTNIDALIAKRNATGSSLKVRISTVLLDDTIHELGTFVQWAADHGLDQVVLNRNQLQDLRVDPQLVQQYVGEAYAAADRNPQLEVQHLDDFDWLHAKRNGLDPLRPRKAFQQEVSACSTAFHTLSVNPHGWAFPCCMTWYFFGNLVEQTLEEVWASEYAYRFRKRMARHDFRDCRVDCEFNIRPINYKVAQVRKAYWVYKRDPKLGWEKTKRVMGLTKPQIDLPKEELVRIENTTQSQSV
jgi:MoaA/NifB/PqqE/SkfB family radical SAM enzyme